MSTNAASAAFSAHAAEYSALRRRLVPAFDTFYGSAVGAIECASAGPIARVLDLGAGTGLMSAAVAEAYPHARFELLDGSPEMLAEAQHRLGERVVAVYVQDMAGELPAGPFDAVVSALAIHHLEDADKRSLFGRVRDVLRPGGVFVNAEQVLGPTPKLAELYVQNWQRLCRELGAGDDELAASMQRRRHDRCADVESQLQWLRAAGFASADCLYKYWEEAVLVAVKGTSA
ncbi:MAG TPA: class I SAM-dependent methyltransferase [Solirubrobacteraceae bacterium]|nr:class I SAM-dependent methyltransferase [Solirubrobacteraceae bacterium]